MKNVLKIQLFYSRPTLFRSNKTNFKCAYLPTVFRKDMLTIGNRSIIFWGRSNMLRYEHNIKWRAQFWASLIKHYPPIDVSIAYTCTVLKLVFSFDLKMQYVVCTTSRSKASNNYFYKLILTVFTVEIQGSSTVLPYSYYRKFYLAYLQVHFFHLHNKWINSV